MRHKSGLFPCPSVRLLERPCLKTRKEVRALGARSLLHVSLKRIFPGFDRNDYLQKAIGWFGVTRWRGAPGVRGGVPRDEAKNTRTALPRQARFAASPSRGGVQTPYRSSRLLIASSQLC